MELILLGHGGAVADSSPTQESASSIGLVTLPDPELPRSRQKTGEATKKRYLRPIAVAAALLAIGGASGAAYAASRSPAIIVTGPDHQRLTFVVSPGGSHVFTLPAANDPIRIDIAKPSTNGGVQTPSEVFSALINVDGNHAGMSWIGTNSNGSQSASSTIHSTDITNLVCGAHCLIASLKVKSVSARTLVLTANAATSGIREEYVVNIWY